ncbi:hypothetical protein Bbelb_199660 [Branchiostoma belcheri]|nr:hypothetical protein Bbelb_199660 [Branchiostoma belcheri]
MCQSPVLLRLNHVWSLSSSLHFHPILQGGAATRMCLHVEVMLGRNSRPALKCDEVLQPGRLVAQMMFVPARPRVGSPDGRRLEGDPIRGRAGTEGRNAFESFHGTFGRPGPYAIRTPRAVPLVITRAGTPVSNVIAAQQVLVTHYNLLDVTNGAEENGQKCLQATKKKVTEHREDDPESGDEVAPGNKDGSGDEVDAEDITRRFKSHRTEYVRLKRLKRGKSGVVSHQPTTLETAAVPNPDEGEEVDDEEVEGDGEVAGTLTGGTTPCGSSAIGSVGTRPCPDGRTPIKKKPATTPSISDVLASFLHDIDKEKKRAQQEMTTRPLPRPFSPPSSASVDNTPSLIRRAFIESSPQKSWGII